MDLFIHYVLIFLFVLIEFLGICGNLLVIVAVQFDARMRRSLTNQLIVRVALCDLFILLLNLPDLIQLIITNDGHWMLDRLACQLIRTSLVLVQYASVLTMCALTVERFVRFPVKKIRFFCIYIKINPFTAGGTNMYHFFLSDCRTIIS